MKAFYDLTDAGRVNRLRRVAGRVLELYDLDVVRLRALPDATNAVFRLDCAGGSRYAMRVGAGPPAGHSAAEMSSEMEWLHALSTIDSPQLPHPVATRTGDLVVTGSAPGVPYAPPCAVFTWLDGPLLADRLDTVSFASYGAAMARLHEAARSFSPSPGFSAPHYTSVYPYASPFTVFRHPDPALLPPPRLTVFERGMGLVDEVFADLRMQEPMRLLHGDLHMWNVKVNRGRIAVFDFEDLLWGWPVQDIGIALYYVWDHDDFDSRLAEFRAGYETVAAWPDPDRQVFACIVARSLLIANDVITQPEWLRYAPEIYERGERRIQDMLDRVGA